MMYCIGCIKTPWVSVKVTGAYWSQEVTDKSCASGAQLDDCFSAQNVKLWNLAGNFSGLNLESEVDGSYKFEPNRFNNEKKPNRFKMIQDIYQAPSNPSPGTRKNHEKSSNSTPPKKKTGTFSKWDQRWADFSQRWCHHAQLSFQEEIGMVEGSTLGVARDIPIAESLAWIWWNTNLTRRSKWRNLNMASTNSIHLCLHAYITFIYICIHLDMNGFLCNVYLYLCDNTWSIFLHTYIISIPIITHIHVYLFKYTCPWQVREISLAQSPVPRGQGLTKSHRLQSSGGFSEPGMSHLRTWWGCGSGKRLRCFSRWLGNLPKNIQVFFEKRETQGGVSMSMEKITVIHLGKMDEHCLFIDDLPCKRAAVFHSKW